MNIEFHIETLEDALRVAENDDRNALASLISDAINFFKAQQERLQAAESKLNEMAQIEPVEIEVTLDGHAHIVSPWHTRLPVGRHALHVAQSNADKVGIDEGLFKEIPICPDHENGNQQYHEGWNECRKFVYDNKLLK